MCCGRFGADGYAGFLIDGSGIKGGVPVIPTCGKRAVRAKRKGGISEMCLISFCDDRSSFESAACKIIPTCELVGDYVLPWTTPPDGLTITLLGLVTAIRALAVWRGRFHKRAQNIFDTLPAEVDARILCVF